jgi:hypothetical protein
LQVADVLCDRVLGQIGNSHDAEPGIADGLLVHASHSFDGHTKEHVHHRPGARLAVGVGSRGITRLPEMVAATLAELRRAGAHPFIVPAMGSHGGATPGGQRGILRYAGGGWSTVSDNSWDAIVDNASASIGLDERSHIVTSATAGDRTITYTAGTGLDNFTTVVNGDASGWFVNWTGMVGPVVSCRLAQNTTTTTGTLLHAVSGGEATTTLFYDQVGNVNTQFISTVGAAYPAVSVYSEGSASSTSTGFLVSGTGTRWSTGAWGDVHVDNAGLESAVDDMSPHLLASILFSTTDGGNWLHRGIYRVQNDTTLYCQEIGISFSQRPYHITRGLPFTDACVHRDSLIGTGCAQYPNRVYICPPGWDLESPPGSVPPLSLKIASFGNLDPNYFFVDFIDVPSTVDTDPMEAIMSSPGPILALKSDDAHGIYGDFPNFTQALLPNGKGSGCFDKRSTVDCRWGQFWAGHNGVFQFTGGRVVNVTEGRIETTWRNLAAEHHGQTGFYCAAGVCGSKLIISIGHDGDAGETLSYDLVSQRWDGFLTNHQAIGFDDPINEVQSLVWAAAPIASDPEKLRDSGPMVDGEGPVVDGALLTTAPAPVMTATTGTGMARNEGIDGLAKMVDLAVSAEVEGPSTGHSKLTPSAEIAGGIDDENENSTTSLPAIEPTTSVSLIQRTRGRINRKGRTFAVKVDTTATPSGNATSAEQDVIVHQITATFRDSRERA